MISVVTLSKNLTKYWHQFETRTTSDPPGIVANNQTSHSLLSEKIALEPLYGLSIQL